MKQEIRIELTENRLLDNIIKKCYFEDDNLGKIRGNENFIEVPKANERHNEFIGLDNNTVKIENEDLIDGILRCLIKEDGDVIKLYPVSIYCIVEHKKYIFY